MDYLIFWSRDESDIDDILNLIIDNGVDLKQEVDNDGFLGVRMECDSDNGTIELNQTGLDDRIMYSLLFDVGATKVKQAPAEAIPLVKDQYG